MEWEYHKELAHLEGVEMTTRTPEEVEPPHSLDRVYLDLYKPGNTESPCHTLDELRSYRLSIPMTEAVDPDSDLGKYQSIERFSFGHKPYQLHLKDKAKFKDLQANQNNMLCGSWHFHQKLDGLMITEGIPLLAISVAAVAPASSAEHDGRFCVTLNVEFKEKEYMDLSLKAGYKTDESNPRIITTEVWVKNPKRFVECVTWKCSDTKAKWAKYEAELEAI